MKRNNLLMLSFIIFMAVCALVKCFWDFPMWGTVVAAITVASWIFAIADLCLCQATAQTKLANEQLDITESSLDEVKMIKKAVDVRLKQVEEKLCQTTGKETTHKLHTVQDELDYLSSVKTDVLEIEEDLQSYFNNLKKGKQGAKTNHFIGCTLTIFGFFAFFAIVVFTPLQALQNGGADEMTVWSFFIILLTQYLETWLEEHRQKKKDSSQKSLNGLDALRKNFESEVVHNYD